jgi:uncharacterized protein
VFYHLILTDKCNLSCSYCRGKSAVPTDSNPGNCVIDTSLPVELAFDLDDLYLFLSRDPHPVLTFYGGEPLLRADLVREILRDAPAEKFILQTNGLLLHELGSADARRLDTILVSIDGPEALTDHYRGSGTYRKVMDEVQNVRSRGFCGELIARMTVAEATDIYSAVHFLADNQDCSFRSIHWQMDADFSDDFDYRNFGKWTRNSYNPGTMRLIHDWIRHMRETGEVLRWYPFLAPMQDLIIGGVARLRCGAGHANYSIMTDGHIAPCPVMVGMKDYYLGHVSTADPAALPEVPIKGACETCAISWFCGGRCLYSNIMRPWSEKQRKFVCETVENMYYGLMEVLPEVQRLLVEGHISLHDFAHTRYNGCEIIP